jgi:hypothetical protein
MDDINAPNLVFRAESGGQYFGLIVARDGWATALTDRDSIRDVLTTTAMQWLKARNPWPEREVSFTLLCIRNGVR